MGWSAIIAAILTVLGPLLADWLKQLIEKWLTKAAWRMPTSLASSAADIGRMFDEAMAGLPRFAFGRRAVLWSVRWAALARAPQLLAGETPSPLDAEEVAELTNNAGAADWDVNGD